MGRFLKNTDYPVYKIPSTDHLIKYRDVFESMLFDIEDDYRQDRNLVNESNLEERMLKKLVKCMKSADTPEEQFERLGICF